MDLCCSEIEIIGQSVNNFIENKIMTLPESLRNEKPADSPLNSVSKFYFKFL